MMSVIQLHVALQQPASAATMAVTKSFSHGASDSFVSDDIARRIDVRIIRVFT